MSDTPRSAPVTFSEFEPVTTAAWQARIERDLKGADPATLRWNTPDGFTLEPFYHREALSALAGQPAPQVPAGTGSYWRNVPTYHVSALSNGHETIIRAADALSRGAEGAHFVLADTLAFDVEFLHQYLPLPDTFIGYTVTAAPAELVQRLLATGATVLRGFLQFDPVTGHLPDMAGQLRALRDVLRLTRGMTDFRGLTLDSAYFGNRGATASQQIAFAVAAAATYFSELPDAELTVADVAAAMRVHTAINPNYFFELAKLRALRRLWVTLCHAYGLPAEAAQVPILAETASWSQTTLDPHTNLLRVTTEAMSAVLGGADVLSVRPFDTLFQEPNEFSDRLARNLSVLLREEAGLGTVADPAAGSYYLETLTDQLAREAWALFQRLEAEGGLPGAMALALQLLHQAAQAQFSRIANGEQVVVGTNRFQNVREQFDFNPKKLLRSREFDSTRATYPSEVLRLATSLHFERREKKKKRAAVVLLGSHTNQLIVESFLRLLPDGEQPVLRESHPEGTLSVLFSSSEEATLMYATPEQFGRLSRYLYKLPNDVPFVPPALLTADLATMQEAVRVFGFQEFTVQGYSTEEVLARLQGKK
ncbi:methylmalonyl-CoA mutase family protein [Hymenobacter psychrotolerans]|uniref:Methylmalonyl-CoA mutase n=1 Tax=Hymenobacter psychrotolerans DSM 18569 TaxID=1121959 RepID=A0A1M6TSF5_9BACT|nr:methylmalonyl-CoA mutase family protein [Hymenobacter psychrotolerans]SHK59854.1 methylmalonyl-CoA mutase [Hymenobacter psychrotolerans DSM 18569]